MTVFENWVYIKTVRELDNFSEAEAMAMLNRIGNYADDYDDILLKKYHAGTAPVS
jgi:predicted nucleic acid-binding Zn finger protein